MGVSDPRPFGYRTKCEGLEGLAQFRRNPRFFHANGLESD
jgi:hypothetical protein